MTRPEAFREGMRPNFDCEDEAKFDEGSKVFPYICKMSSNYPDDMYDWLDLPEEKNDAVKTLKEGALLAVELNGKKICIVKVGEQYFGINDRCPHAGTPFHLGTCNKKGIIVCPTHHYKFDVKTGLSADGNHYKIPTFKVKEAKEKFIIGFRK